jgi:hypothetical protein
LGCAVTVSELVGHCEEAVTTEELEVGDKPGAVVAVGVVVDVVAATTDFVVGGLESDELHPAAMAPSKVNVPTTIGNRHPRDAITFEYSQPEMPLTAGFRHGGMAGG